MKLLLVLLTLTLPGLAKDKSVTMVSATVVSQEIRSQQNGTYSGPSGNGSIVVPMYGRSNLVGIETAESNMMWTEVMSGRGPLVLPVHGEVQFYRDGNWFIVLDANNRKHKFRLISLVLKKQ